METQTTSLTRWQKSGRSAAKSADYSLLLRVIGQELESKGITTCCLWAEGEAFEVIGLSAASAHSLVESGFWQRLTARRVAATHSTLELRYSVEQLVQIDELNRAKRGLGLARSDFLSLSEQLRTLGAIVDRRKGTLLRLDRLAYEGMISSFTVQYRLPSGELMTEEFSAPSLYDFSVQIFMMEKRRSLAGRMVPRAA